MGTCKTGLNRMPAIVARATGDIKHRLWSLYWLVRMTHQNFYIIELGVRGGDSTRALLAACEDIGEKRLVSHDVEDCDHSVDDPVLRSHWGFYKMDSVEAGRLWEMEVDFIFIDTDHTFNTTREEIAAWAPHVRIGGCMAFHDYWLHDPPRDENQGHGVKMAVDEWANLYPQSWELETWDAGPDGDTGFAILWKRK